MGSRNIRQVGFDFYANLDDLLSDKSSSFMLDKDKDVYYEDFVNEGHAAAWRMGRTVKKFNDKVEEKYGLITEVSFDKKKDQVSINESTYKELIKVAESKRKERSKHLKTRYMGVSDKKGWIKFQTNSQFIPTKKYMQYIQLAEADDMKYFKEFKQQDVVRLFMSGDIKLFCQCPDFRYRYRYMASQFGYGIFSETRFPKIRNPRLEGSVCKHLIFVLSVFQLQWMRIARDLRKTKFFKKKFLDVEDSNITGIDMKKHRQHMKEVSNSSRTNELKRQREEFLKKRSEMLIKKRRKKK